MHNIDIHDIDEGDEFDIPDGFAEKILADEFEIDRLVDNSFDSENVDYNSSRDKYSSVMDKPSFDELKGESLKIATVDGDKYVENKYSDEIIELIFENEIVRVERIYSKGSHTKEGMWYNQKETESVKITNGEAIMTVGNKMLNLIGGDALIIPAHEKHRVDFTSPDCEWICAFFKI